MLLPLFLNKAQPRRRRRTSTKIIASIIIAGCVLQFYNAAFDDHASSSNNTIDYDHYVPSHRFLLVENNDADIDNDNDSSSLMSRQLMLGAVPPSSSSSSASENLESLQPQQDDGPTTTTTTTNTILKGLYKGPRKVTLRPRSQSEITTIKQRATRAAQMRAMGVTSESELYASLSPELQSSITSTSNAAGASIPYDRRVNVTSYDIDSALLAVRSFQREILFFVYDSSTDDFVILHNLPDCNWGCKRTYLIAPVIAYALRKNYPERFQGSASGDLVFLLSVGDMPRVRRPCLFEKTNNNGKENKNNDDKAEGGGGSGSSSSSSSSYCKSDKWAPILQFGSVLSDTKYMPSVIAMPQSPRPHIPCIAEFQKSGTVCQDLQPRVMSSTTAAATETAQDQVVGQGHEDNTQALRPLNTMSAMGQHFQHGLVYGQMLGLVNTPNYWDNLIPQVIWRGTDFMFLHTLFPDMRSPNVETDIIPYEETFDVNVQDGEEFLKYYESTWTSSSTTEKKKNEEEESVQQVPPPDGVVRGAIRALWNMGQDELTPRWRGVLLTSEAELDARTSSSSSTATTQEEEQLLPWVNIKFASYNVNGLKVSANENPEYQVLQNKYGISAIGNSMNMMEQARYKYHIDLGGGGGTTWTGVSFILSFDLCLSLFSSSFKFL